MTKITTMENRVEQINGILDEMVRYTGEKEALTKDFEDVLYLIIPSDGHRLLTLGDWRYSPALEPEITEWLAGDPDSEEQFRLQCYKLLMDGDKVVHVHAQHMMGDHWKNSVFNDVLPPEADEESRNSRTGMLAGTRGWPWPASWGALTGCPGPSPGPHASRRAAAIDNPMANAGFYSVTRRPVSP